MTLYIMIMNIIYGIDFGRLYFNVKLILLYFHINSVKIVSFVHTRTHTHTHAHARAQVVYGISKPQELCTG